ncbi:hypothetical protein NIES4073_42560 [Kalymmatonema gypsitolerans NIES-4073]|nr:hypothetical protein NIES4073_42560 [Scytonema sp. NIES-4073]
MRVPKQKHNASSKQAPQHSVVGKSDRQPTKSPQQSQLVQRLSRVGNAANAGNHAAILNRAPDHQQSANKNLLLHLQRQYGNSYVNQVVKQAQHNSSASSQQPPIQTKLTIGPVGDKYEREADRTAAAVVQRINAPNPVQSAGGQAIQREKMPEEELQKKPQITAIQREVMPPEDEQQAQMKPAELVQTKKPEEEDKQKQAAKKTALAGPPQPKKIKEEDKKKLLRKQAASNPSKSKKQEEDDKLKHLQKKSDAIAEHGHKEEDEDKLPIHKKSHPDADSTKKPEEEDKLKHLQKKSDTHAEHGQKEEDEDKLSVQKKSHPGADPDKKLEEDDDKHLMQAKSEVSGGHEDKHEEDKMAQMQPLVQRRSGEGGTDATADVESAIKHARGKGRPLPDNVRSSMENAFGADFSGVKVHTDTHADQLNRSIQARAFTTGQDVFFRHGEFALGSKRGQELLAHELTHVVQQNGNAVQPKSLAKHEKSKQNKLQSKTKLSDCAEKTAIPEQNAHSAPLAAKATSADASQPDELVQEQTLLAEAGSGEIQLQRQAAGGGGGVPTSPEDDPDYQQAVNNTQQVGEEQSDHEPAEEEAENAQAAAEPPANEVESKAQGRQVSEKMHQAETPEFNADAFKAALMKRIAEITPKNLDEADKFKDSNKLQSVKTDMNSKVDDEQKASQGPLEEKAKETPDTSGIDKKQVTPLSPQEPGEAPSTVGAESATPKAKPAAQVEQPVKEGSDQLDKEWGDVTEEQINKSNEPQFLQALDTSKQYKQEAPKLVEQYRQSETNQISQAKTEATATEQEKLQGMHGERTQSLQQVGGKQENAKGKDEEARTKIAGDLQKIYDQTKTKVEKILSDLDKEVEKKFDKGAADARKAFEDYVAQKMDAYKNERYGNWWDPSKWGNRIRDWFAGLPDEVNRFYEEGRDLYLRKMDVVITDIANLVATKLNEAKAEVANGKQQVEEYVKQLPEDLKQIGEEAAENIQSQFDELEQSIRNKQDELIDTLANKYKENLDAVDARIKEMQEANRGLIQKAIDFVKGVVETIKSLAQMLAQVLARAASVIPQIIKDPVGFVKNLIEALKQGFQNFVANIKQHLMQGLMGWLTGTLASTGIQLPESLDEKGIFSLVMQLLGLTYQHIRGKVAQRIGEEKVGYLEKSFEMFKILATQGLAGLWQVIKDKIGDVKAMVLDPIQNYIIESVIKGGIQSILSLMTPASAFIKACQAIVQIVQFFIENAQRIIDLINAVVDAVIAVANGNIGQAVKRVESALAGAIPLVIDFLAKLLGLGNIGQKVQDIIRKLRQPVEKAVDWVINQGVKFAKTLDKKFKQSKVGKKVQSAKETARKKKEAAQKFINKKKEAVEKRYQQEKNKLLKSKAGKKQLDALKKKRDAAKKKFDAAKNWPAKKLKALIGRKDNKQQGVGKNKAGRKKDAQKPNKIDHKRLAKLAVMELEKTDRKPKDYKSLRAEKQVQAKQIEKSYTQKLEKGIKLTVRFEDATKDEKDGQLDFKVVIAPNDTTDSGKISLPDLKPPYYFVEQKYGNLKRNSGSSMSVILGPKIDNSGKGSETNHESIPDIIKPLNNEDFTVKEKRTASGETKNLRHGLWVAGHLLNANLGGSGQDPKNLTPLTQIANIKHKNKIETKIKTLMTQARQRSEGYKKDLTWKGVKYSVDVSDETFGDNPPWDKAPSHITINATKVEVKKKAIPEEGCKTESELDIINQEKIESGLEIHNEPADVGHLTAQLSQS